VATVIGNGSVCLTHTQLATLNLRTLAQCSYDNDTDNNLETHINSEIVLFSCVLSTLKDKLKYKVGSTKFEDWAVLLT
jgi:hypothetical protein